MPDTQAPPPAPTGDRWVVLSVVNWLGVLSLVLVLGSIWVIHDSLRVAPDGSVTVSVAVAPLVGLAGTALGALGAMLASTRTATPDLQRAESVGFNKAAELGQALAALPAPPDQPGAPPVVEAPVTVVAPPAGGDSAGGV